MNRTDGLVRRLRTRDPSEANNSSGQVDDNDNASRDQDDQELEDNDSKETRLTLMEEVLLLGLKDKEVIITKRQTCHNAYIFGFF